VPHLQPATLLGKAAKDKSPSGLKALAAKAAKVRGWVGE
jgi:hypothetical protein